MKMEGVAGGKLGNTNYTMVEAKYGGVVVWPTSVATTYEIDRNTLYYVFYNGNGQAVYSATRLKADGSLHAKLYGDVKVYENNVYKRTILTAELEIRLPTTSPFYVSDNSIYSSNLGTTETSVQTSDVYMSYATYGPTFGPTITQEANVKTYVDTVYGEKSYGTPSVVRIYGYTLMGFTASDYTSSSSPCPASGGTATLQYGTCFHLEDVETPWTRSVTNRYTYTATGATLHGEPQTPQSDYDLITNTVPDTPTIVKFSGASAITLSELTVTIPDRGTNEGAARSATFRATNGDATPQDVTIYQEANVATTTYVYDLVIAIYGSGNLSYLADNYPVTGHSKRTPTTTYTSGSSTTGTAQSVSSTITATNCTANDGNGNTITTVSGDFGFFVQTTDNYSGQTRNIVVAIAPDGVTPVSDSRTQDAQPAQPYIEEADLTPFIATFNSGNFVNGKTYTMFTITGSHNTSSATLQDVWFKYRVNNSIDYSVRIGELQVSQQSSSDLPELVPYSGYTLPTFKAGETYGYNDRFSSGDTVYAWFTVGNKGIIGQLDTHENSPFYITIP